VPLIPTGELVARARAAGTGIAAVNAITLEHAEAIVAAAASRRRPVIVQISQNAARFHDGVRPLAAAARALAEDCRTDVALHLDHVEDESLLRAAADAGFSSVMFDAGTLPYDDNVAATREAAAWAHDNGLWLEAELGYVGGKPSQPQRAHAAGVRTNAVEARDFVAATGVDALAVAVGSSHAMTTRSARLDAELIARLRAAVPVPLVLHGSSGVPDDELRAAIAAGITKVNVGTALNIAYTEALREELAADEAVVDPRRYLAPVRDAVTATVAALVETVTNLRE
jgi:fructose-bisphosphate aldolase class II